MNAKQRRLDQKALDPVRRALRGWAFCNEQMRKRHIERAEEELLRMPVHLLDQAQALIDEVRNA